MRYDCPLLCTESCLKVRRWGRLREAWSEVSSAADRRGGAEYVACLVVKYRMCAGRPAAVREGSTAGNNDRQNARRTEGGGAGAYGCGEGGTAPGGEASRRDGRKV